MHANASNRLAESRAVGARVGLPDLRRRRRVPGCGPLYACIVNPARSKRSRFGVPCLSLKFAGLRQCAGRNSMPPRSTLTESGFKARARGRASGGWVVGQPGEGGGGRRRAGPPFLQVNGSYHRDSRSCKNAVAMRLHVGFMLSQCCCNAWVLLWPALGVHTARRWWRGCRADLVS